VEASDESLKKFVLEAGPRAITPDLPQDLLTEIGTAEAYSPTRELMRRMKLAENDSIEREIQWRCKMNRIEEETMHGTTSHIPDARIPLRLVQALEAQEKELWNPAMREDTLRCYPGLRLNVKRGIHGQQYVKGR
jgi:hypothetical protein